MNMVAMPVDSKPVPDNAVPVSMPMDLGENGWTEGVFMVSPEGETILLPEVQPLAMTQADNGGPMMMQSISDLLHQPNVPDVLSVRHVSEVPVHPYFSEPDPNLQEIPEQGDQVDKQNLLNQTIFII